MRFRWYFCLKSLKTFIFWNFLKYLPIFSRKKSCKFSGAVNLAIVFDDVSQIVFFLKNLQNVQIGVLGKKMVFFRKKTLIFENRCFREKSHRMHIELYYCVRVLKERSKMFFFAKKLEWSRKSSQVFEKHTHG